MTAAYDKALAPAGLRITQFAILRVLDRTGAISVTRLAAEASLDRSTIGRNLDPLERRGLVRIDVGDRDQRERIVHLTAPGRAALEASMPFWRGAQAELAQRVSVSAIEDIAERMAILSPRA